MTRSAIKLYYPLRVDAQAKADSIHAWMQANTPGYARSVQDGQTVRWAVPAQDLDDKGLAIVGSQWFVIVKDRCDGALSAAEKLLRVATAPSDTK